MTSRILSIPFDHLNRNKGVLKDLDPKSDVVVLVESARMTSGRDWHKERLFFLISSARHFAEELKEAADIKVEYIKAETTTQGLDKAKSIYGDLPVYSAEPSSFRSFAQLTEYGVQFVTNDLFLTKREDFFAWAKSQKTYVMENFYRAQRVRLNILVEDGKPEGGAWNFDADNRLPPPKNYEWPDYLYHDRDEIDLEVAKELDHEPTRTWATTRKGALAQLDYFIKHHLDGFGPYEDAVVKDNWALHHSLLSPYLNNGLLDPAEAVLAVINSYKQGKARIQSVEAFVRQVIGWREYVNGMYWFLGGGL